MALGLFGILIAGNIGVTIASRYAQTHYDFSNLIPYFLYIVVSLIGGIILGLEPLLKNRTSAAPWKVDWLRILYLGVPALFFAVYLVLCFIFGLKMLPLKITTIFITEPAFISLNAFILGYIIITSFYKEDHA
jgi:drug/metabolite transporter (DMT)-like permease